MSDKTPLDTIMALPYREVKDRIAAFKAEHPKDDGSTVEAHDWRTQELVKAYKAASEAAATAKETMERTRLALMERMGDSAVLNAGSFIVKFPTYHKDGYWVDPFDYRSIRVTKTTTTAKAAKATASRKVVVDGEPANKEVPAPE
jgi:hypothetical protein